MAEIFKFFNSAPGDERWHYASDFADYFGGVLSDGILHTDKQTDLGLRVSVVTGTLTTKVSVGKAIIKGYAYENTTDLTLKHDIPEPTLKRIDRIVLRLDLSNSSRYVKLFVKKGTSATSPIAPTLQRDQYIHELSLAQVLVRENTTQLIETDLKDERMIESLCGLVSSIISVPTTQFQEQWDAWFESVKNEGFAPYSDTGFKQNLKTMDKTTIVGAVNELKDDYVRSPGYATATGTNTYSVTLNPAPTSYKDGMGLVVKINTASTGATTINVNGLGAKPILKANGAPVSDLKAGAVYSIRYNGMAFILQGEGGDEREIVQKTISQIKKTYFITFIDNTFLYAVDNDGTKAYKILKSNMTIIFTFVLPVSQIGNSIEFYSNKGVLINRRNGIQVYTSIYNESGTLIKEPTALNCFAYDGTYFYQCVSAFVDSEDGLKLKKITDNGTLIKDLLFTNMKTYIYQTKICFFENSNIITVSVIDITNEKLKCIANIDTTNVMKKVLIDNVIFQSIAHNTFALSN